MHDMLITSFLTPMALLIIINIIIISVSSIAKRNIDEGSTGLTDIFFSNFIPNLGRISTVYGLIIVLTDVNPFYTSLYLLDQDIAKFAPIFNWILIISLSGIFICCIIIELKERRSFMHGSFSSPAYITVFILVIILYNFMVAGIVGNYMANKVIYGADRYEVELELKDTIINLDEIELILIMQNNEYYYLLERSEANPGSSISYLVPKDQVKIATFQKRT